jgi:Rho family protein
VIIGDGNCGKTSLLCHFTLGYFPNRYVPAIFENFVIDCRVDGRPVQSTLCDTSGQEDDEALRLLTYAQSDIVIIGFSVDSTDSLANVRHNWIEEVKERCPGIIIYCL